MIDGRGESPEEFTTYEHTADFDPFAPIRENRVMPFRIDEQLRGLELVRGEPEYMLYAAYAANIAAAYDCEIDASLAVAWGIRDLLAACANAPAGERTPDGRAKLPFLPKSVQLDYEELVIPPSHRNRNEVVVYRATRYITTSGRVQLGGNAGAQVEAIGSPYNACHIYHPLAGFTLPPKDVPYFRPVTLRATGTSDSSGLN